MSSFSMHLNFGVLFYSLGTSYIVKTDISHMKVTFGFFLVPSVFVWGSMKGS